jgi:hypothetical protein
MIKITKEQIKLNEERNFTHQNNIKKYRYLQSLIVYLNCK